MKMRCDSEQTAHLQAALLHLPMRTQIRTAQSGSIRYTGLGAIAATQGKPEFTGCRLDLSMHLREHVFGRGVSVLLGSVTYSVVARPLRPYSPATLDWARALARFAPSALRA